MDDPTQNSVQPDPVQQPAPVAATDAVAMPPVPAPVDPMDNVQVPDLSVSPLQVPADPAGVLPQAVPSENALQSDSGQAMQQMATSPSMAPDPAPQVADMVAVVPQSQVEDPLPQADATNLGPVTMEDLMEELQHIEDKLDEMDEKL